jgi:hypothetical protein
MRNRNVFNIFNLLAETAGVPWSAGTDKQRYRLTRVKEARPHRFGGSYTMKMRYCQLAAIGSNPFGNTKLEKTSCGAGQGIEDNDPEPLQRLFPDGTWTIVCGWTFCIVKS